MNFDIDLKFGQSFENKVRDMLENDGTIEVKTERDIWKTTGNICFEYLYKGRPSGISTTDAKWWIHILADGDKIETGFIFPVEELRKKLKTWSQWGAKKVKGGDDNQSTMLLIPIKWLVQTTEKGMVLKYEVD